MAAGVLGVLREANDIALVGYDDSAVAPVTDPPLTTVVNPVAATARTAGAILLEGLQSGGPVGPPLILPPELVVRACT